MDCNFVTFLSVTFKKKKNMNTSIIFTKAEQVYNVFFDINGHLGKPFGSILKVY